VVSPLYDTRAVGDIILGLAQRLDFGAALPWKNMEACVREGWREIFERGVPGGAAESFETFWTSVLEAGVWGQAAHRATPAVEISPRAVDGVNVEVASSSEAYPFVLHPYLSIALNDGRGANLPWMQELPDPLTSIVYGSWVELNPATAKELGLSEGDVVDVQSAHGQLTAPVFVYPAIRPDVVAMPIGQGHGEYGRYAKNRGVNPIQILAPEIEPSTGSLAWSDTRVKLIPTGRRVKLVKTDGTSRDLGRNIIHTTGSAAGAEHSAKLQSIPIKVAST
jgi:anaerobic selenocysteine-containing dehydrogenase